MGNDSRLNSIHSRYLLDEAWSPVARFRLLSPGVNENTRLLESIQVIGDCGCLACGNCIDVCPVVKENVGLVFEQNQRTSMALENYVQEECRRCYRCVNACPQVSKDLKEYALGFRRVEKMVHLLAAFCVVSLAATGIIHLHYLDVLGRFESDLLKYGHRTIGILSILIPILYYKLDIGHFRRTLKKIFQWGKADWEWLKNTKAHIFRSGHQKAIARHEFNPGQKIWYLFILILFPILYMSGLIAIVMGPSGETAGLVNLVVFHMIFALLFDIMLFIHIYMKYVREWIKDCFKIFKNYRRTKSFVFTRNQSC